MSRSAFIAGVREALGGPALVLGAGFVGFGALAKASGWSVWLTTFSTMAVWALPGQLVLLDLATIGAPAAVIVLAVFFTNTRFLPMSMTFMPVVRHDAAHRPWRYYVAAQFVSVLSWTVCMVRCAELGPRERLPFFVGFSSSCWLVCMATGAAGFVLAGSIPHALQLGFVFMGPLYLLLLIVGGVRERISALAMTCGAIGGPCFHLLNPQWSVLLAGFVGGTLAFYLAKALRRG